MQRFYQQTGEYVPIERLLDHLWEHPIDENGRRMPLLIWGGAGVGKTQQVNAYARNRGRKMTVYHPAHDVSGADIVGESRFNETTRKLEYALPPFLPVEGDPDGILFVDELNRGSETVLAGLMELFGEGTISQSGWKLPSNWQLVAAANPSELGYQVNELDQAMVDRCLHYAPGWDASSWAQWADSTGRFKDEVIDFVLANPHMVETGEAQLPLEIQNKLRATPRSMDYFNSLYEPDLAEGMLFLIAEGILGRAAAEEFILQHVGERALTVEAMLAGGYDDTLRRWQSQGNEPLISASSKRLVAYLVGRPVDEKTAQKLGRFIALLPSGIREECFVLLSRSAVEWHLPLEATTNKWRTFLAQRHQLIPGK